MATLARTNGTHKQAPIPDLTRTPPAASYGEALPMILGTLQAEYPRLADVLGRANALLTEGRLSLEPDGHGATITSADGAQTYHVEAGLCDCPTAQYHPKQVCKHRYALRMHQMVLAHLALAADSPTTPPILDGETGGNRAMLEAIEADDWGQEPETEVLPTSGSERAHAVPVPTMAGVPIASGIERSAEIGTLMVAFARAQAQMQNPVFDGANPQYKNRYASLRATREAVIPHLTAQGIAVMQLPTTPREGWLAVTTGLWLGEQYLCTTFSVPVPKQDPQGYGSALTYLKRYGLQSVCCVVGEEDDDAEGAKVPPRR